MNSHAVTRLAFIVFSVACAGHRIAPADHTSRTFDRLTAADFAMTSERSLEGAIGALRPSYLRTNYRGESPTVFVNGIQASSPRVLRDVPASDVVEVRFLRGFEATTRYGSIHSGAVIEVTLRKR